MRKIRKITRDKKGIDTILAALLMVVIVVVAAVMVYAWATGLLSALLVQNPVPKESLNVESFAFTTNNTVVTLSVRNTGSVAIAFSSYYVKDSSGNQIALTAWSSAPGYPASINPNGLGSVNIRIGSSCTSGCTGGGSFTTFQSGLSYTVTLVTTRNNQFVWTGTR
jgi:FlaG/FlaF family flagellin (archaellin)